MLGLYRDNGKENGNYLIIIGYILGLYWGYIIEQNFFWVVEPSKTIFLI